MKRLLPAIGYLKRTITDPANWKAFFHWLIKLPPRIFQTTFLFVTFFIILIHILVTQVLVFIFTLPGIRILSTKFEKPWNTYVQKHITKGIAVLESYRKSNVQRTYLIYLALQNLKSKRSRSMITMLGMSVGVGIIVYLLSLGYGLERLIISQVAGLDELKIVDVSASENTALRIDTSSLEKIRKIRDVEEVVPFISSVGRVNYQKANIDVLVYAVSKKFLEVSKIKPVQGDLFKDSAFSYSVPLITSGDVAGVKKTLKDGVFSDEREGGEHYINIVPQEHASVWSECSNTSELLGYTIRQEGGYTGLQVWGSSYAPFDPHGRTGYDGEREQYLGEWVKAKVPLYQKSTDDSLVPQYTQNGYHTWKVGCIQQKYVQITGKRLFIPEVLGDATSSAQIEMPGSTTSASLQEALSASPGTTASALANIPIEVVSTDSSGIQLVRLGATKSASLKASKTVEFKNKPKGEAIISTGLMKLLGVSDKNILKTKFKVKFIITKTLLPEIEGRAFSQETTYSVVGVVDDDAQFFYVPIADFELMGIGNFSQLKVVMSDKNSLDNVREQIETLGYNTTSVSDTVAQIEELFANLRLVLGLLGSIALAVASLGMFNTLTVSLLERTREIGGMKTIGMVSDEIQDLFLAEAMVMGLSGGIGGILIGYIGGKITSISISLIAISQGLGYIELTYIPKMFIMFILATSFVVGVVTGLYPAQRAKKISALNALRYE